MDIKNLFGQKIWKWFLIVLSGMVILVFVFGLGVQVGFNKSRALFLFGQPGIGRPQRGFGPFGMVPGPGMMQGHGTVGFITKISGNEVVVKNVSGAEVVVTIDQNTIVRKERTAVGIKDLTVGNQVVIFGQPALDGTLVAKLIRVVDSAGPEWGTLD